MKVLSTIGIATIAAASIAGGAKPSAFELKGTFVEGCSCAAPCTCEVTGLEMGCQGVGGMSLTGGHYGGVSLAGAKIAYGLEPGSWVRLYVEAKNPAQRKAAEAFGRAAYTAFGKIESCSAAKISVTASGENMTLTVDGGKIMTLKTKPLLGHNKKPVEINNMNDPVHPNNRLGTSTTCTFSDGGHSFTISDKNVFYAKNLNSKGKI